MNQQLSVQRQNAIDIFQAGLKAVEPGTAVKNKCRLDHEVLKIEGQNYPLDKFDKIIVIGAGKAGAPMAKALEEILGEHIAAGLISVKYGHVDQLNVVKIMEAGHPVPDDNGIAAAQAIYDLARTADEKTLVLCVISGGGSALLPLPVAGVSLEDKQNTTKVLLECGATIHEINAIRKHLSVIKGGGLAKAVFPGTLVTLILSDVVGDDLDSIASGPCVPDSRTFSDCQAIVEKYSISDRIPRSVMQRITDGVSGLIPETPKKEEAFFAKTQNVVVGSNFNALLTAKLKADELGYNSLLISSMLEGETRDVAANHIAIAREISVHGQPLKRPACLLSGGETTVKIRGKGKGGRNQEFVLAAALRISDLENIVVMSAGTDGNDGPTDAAGAIADHTTLSRAREDNLDPSGYLADNDSYHFFERLADLVKTGPTNTNVMDLRIILVY
ncbi:MAG: glycerate kinase [Desulfuromonadales bacterium]|nr:glycerate kinase [Desulfuromonadales bacterium]MBN2793086.1 glycerate kinase [Desulfuromonadales bacterium]